MGHSNTAITQWCLHPQAVAIEQAFQILVAEVGHHEPLPAHAGTQSIELIEQDQGVSWWTWRGSNSRPHDCQSCALPTAPQAPSGKSIAFYL